VPGQTCKPCGAIGHDADGGPAVALASMAAERRGGVLQVALKVDVDTLIGLQEGVPNLLTLFRRLSIPASFFVAFGPDNSGKAIRRIFKRGFVQKMWRTNPLQIYGLKTLLRGTFLPSPVIGQMAPEVLTRVMAEGHELGIHGYDHVLWQDSLDRLGEPAIARELARAIALYERAVNCAPNSAAAPGWKVNCASLALQDRHRFLYCSDTRGAFPFFPTLQGCTYQTLQIPTTLPTLDEVLGCDGMWGSCANDFLAMRLRHDRLNVHTIHAEVEGRVQLPLFEAFVTRLEAQGAEYVRLCEVAHALLSRGRENIPHAPIERRPIPGRAGDVACQAVDEPT
jgi:undecaprenyl phosphate-alpha-L-ara4FN deformylase